MRYVYYIHENGKTLYGDSFNSINEAIHSINKEVNDRYEFGYARDFLNAVVIDRKENKRFNLHKKAEKGRITFSRKGGEE